MDTATDEDKTIVAQPCGEGQTLTRAQIDQWREQGYTMVSGLFSASLIDELKQAALAVYPLPGTPEATSITDFGSVGSMTFPSQVSSLNDVTLDQSLLAAVAALLGRPIEDLRLTQSDLWTKYGQRESSGIQDNSDQRIHVDYPNHTLAHPASWDRPEAVEMIVYFDDAAETGGGTAVVPRQGVDDPAYRWPIVDSPGIGDLRYINDRTAAEAYFAEERPALGAWRESLYEREKHAGFKPGDVLFYRHDTWHRGTPMVEGTQRVVLNMTYRLVEAEWISTLHIGWAWKAYRDNKYLERLIAGASLQQRAVMGFPQPGNRYWTPETVAAVEARYGMFGMDMTPYRAALDS